MFYVAYGSNMNLEQMKYRCPNSKVLGTGIMRGWKLVFNVHADVRETGNNDDCVPVVIWNVPKSDCAKLDIYEGYPNYYIRKMVDVEGDDGSIIRARVYVMNGLTGIYPPTEGYFNTCVDGCIDNGINFQYMIDAAYYSFENMTSYNQYTEKKRKAGGVE